MLDQIQRKLESAGYEVTAPPDLTAAGIDLDAHDTPAVVICDNLEPTNHLRLLRQNIGVDPRRAVPQFVLLAAGRGATEAEARRSRSLGAIGAWCEPFAVADLQNVLAQGGLTRMGTKDPLSPSCVLQHRAQD